MSRDDKFFQFPVAALRLDASPLDVDRNQAVERLDEIQGYCIVDVGKNFIAKHDEEEVDRIIDNSAWTPDGKLTAHQKDVLCGMAVLDVSFKDAEAKVHKFSFADEYKLIDRLSGGSKILRLRTDLYWSYRDNKNDWTWREFSILCGIYAGIGAKPSAQLSYQYIGALAAGYSRLADLPSQYAMPMHVVRHTVRKLESRSFVRSLCANGRHTHYSKSQNITELAESLFIREKQKIQSEKAAALESLRQRMAGLKPKPSKKPPKPAGDVKREMSHPGSNGKSLNSEHATELRRQEIINALNGLGQ
jgi:hypothetical protein